MDTTVNSSKAGFDSAWSSYGLNDFQLDLLKKLSDANVTALIPYAPAIRMISPEDLYLRCNILVAQLARQAIGFDWSNPNDVFEYVDEEPFHFARLGWDQADVSIHALSTEKDRKECLAIIGGSYTHQLIELAALVNCIRDKSAEMLALTLDNDDIRRRFATLIEIPTALPGHWDDDDDDDCESDEIAD